jgi:hypothetical protein
VWFLQERIYLTETLSYNSEIEIYSEENKVFLIKEFLAQGNRGKLEFKIIEVIIMNLGIFDEIFRIFG